MPQVKPAEAIVGPCAESLTECLVDSPIHPRRSDADLAMRQVDAITRRIVAEGWRSGASGCASVRSRVLVLWSDDEDDRSNALVDATRLVFDDAAVDVEMLGLHDDAALRGFAQRVSGANALFVVAPASTRCVERLATLLDDLIDRPASLVAARAYGLVVTGDMEARDQARRILSDALDDCGLIDAAAQARLDRFLGYETALATGAASWYADDPIRESALDAARELVNALIEIHAGRLTAPDLLLARPRLPA